MEHFLSGLFENPCMNELVHIFFRIFIFENEHSVQEPLFTRMDDLPFLTLRDGETFWAFRHCICSVHVVCT